MDDIRKAQLDRLAGITADVDRLQADIDYGRAQYTGDIEVQKELDATQAYVNDTREFVKKWTRINQEES